MARGPHQFQLAIFLEIGRSLYLCGHTTRSVAGVTGGTGSVEDLEDRCREIRTS
jgi:hypothetical protein